jgi:hypothetical protein
MIRLCIPVGLTIATLILPGCANRQQVDLSQWRDYRPETREESTSRTKVTMRSEEVPGAKSAGTKVAMRSQVTPGAKSDVVESTGTVGRATGTVDGPSHMRPWPKRGTPEFEQLQAEEAEREARIRDAIRSICRGC